MDTEAQAPMQSSKSIERYCNAPTRHGNTRCRRPAGWGTPFTTGPCKNHGGALPTVQTHHARLEALKFARGQLGQELDIDPLEGVLVAVRLSYGLVDHWRHRLTQNATDIMREGYAKAITDYARICDIAIKAGVAERQIRIIERHAEQLSLIFEDLMAAGHPSSVQREAMAKAWVAGLQRLEEPTIDGTAEDVAA